MKFKVLGQKNKKLFKRFLLYLKPYKVRYVSCLILILFEIGLQMLEPLIWGNLILGLFSKNSNMVTKNVIYTVCIYIFKLVIHFLQSYIFSFLSNNIIFDLKKDMYKAILNLPVKAFDENGVGEFISRLHQDASNVTNIITDQILTTVIDIVKVIVIGIMVFSINVNMSLIVILGFPFSYYVFKKFGTILKNKNKQYMNLSDLYFKKIQQSIYGIREIKSLGIKKLDFNNFKNIIFELKNKSINLNILSTISNILSQSISFICEILIIIYGSYLVIVNKLAVNYYIAFSSYSGQFTLSLLNITRINSTLQQVLVSLERIFDLMDNLSYEKESNGKLTVNNIQGKIIFDKVSFNYSDDKKILKDISFEIEKNTKVAIVGNSGSGKTTIFNLLLKFYDNYKGNIFIDNINIKDFNENSLRKHISIVRQEPYLFNISIKDNLLLGNPNATFKDIKNACKSVFIDEYIMSLPEKYNSIVGENGINFSGGQKQRIAIARALLKKSKIILFDEATSSLDNQSQSYVKDTINEIAKNHTVIIIAHRLSTIDDCDKIFVINDGIIFDKGTHEELIKNCIIYKKLYDSEDSNMVASI